MQCSHLVSHDSQVQEVEHPRPALLLLVWVVLLIINTVVQCCSPSLDLGQLQWEVLALSSFLFEMARLCVVGHQTSSPVSSSSLHGLSQDGAQNCRGAYE